MSDSIAPSASSEASDSLEERLARALPRLRAHLSRRGRRVPGAESEDVAQEVMARALRYRNTYDPGRSLWPWLQRMADRVLNDHRRAAAKRPSVSGELDPVAADEPAALDATDEVECLLAGLPERERHVLLRFHQQGQSVRNIARELGVPEGTVKSSLSRARRRLASERDEEEAP